MVWEEFTSLLTLAVLMSATIKRTLLLSLQNKAQNLPALVELLVADSCALNTDKGDTVDSWETISMIREKDIM